MVVLGPIKLKDPDMCHSFLPNTLGPALPFFRDFLLVASVNVAVA